MGYNKFRAKRVKIHGHNFPSKLEASVYMMLHELEQAGKIVNLQTQVKVEPEKCPTCGKHEAEPVKVDFMHLDLETGQNVYTEAKGITMPRFARFARWWKTSGPAVLEIWKAGRRGPRLAERIVPKWMGEY